MKPLIRLSYWMAAPILLLGCFDTLSAQNAFVVSPTSLSYSFNGANPAPQTQNLTVSTSGAPVSFNLSFVNANQGGCNAIVPGSYSPTTPTIVPITVYGSFLGAGTYNCPLVLSTNQSGGFQATIPLTITVGGGGGTSGQLSVSPTSLILTAQTGTAPTTSSVTITNANPSVGVSFTAAVTSSPTSWLQINPVSATVTSPVTLQVQANPTGLGAGSYSGTIVVTPAGSAAISIPVTLTVSGNPTVQVQQNSTAVTAVNRNNPSDRPSLETSTNTGRS